MLETQNNIQQQIYSKIGSKGIKMKSYYSQILIQLLFDVVAIIISFLGQYFFRFETGIFSSPAKGTIAEISLAMIVFVLYWITVYFFSGMYKNWYERSPFDEIFSVAKVNFLGSVLIFFFVFSDTSSSPRMLFIFYFLLMTFTVVIGRTIARHLQRSLRIKGIVRISAVIIGSADSAAIFHKRIIQQKQWGYDSAGIVLCDEAEYNEKKAELEEIGIQVLGKSSDLKTILSHLRPEVAVISIKNPDHTTVLDITEAAAEYNVRVKIEPNLYDIFTGQAKTQNLYGIPLIEVNTQIIKPWQEAIKRLFDIFFSLIVLIVGLPFWILIGILVVVDSRGPMFFTQIRVGKDGKNFKMFKFRSMTFDKNIQHSTYTIMNDPRVTRFGRLIRKTHLDEIPQFFNTLIGDMSVVGPRPEMPANVEKFSAELPYYRRRLKVRPGITGWWQVKYGPHILDVEEIKGRLKDDFYYIENLSLKLDIEIVVRTVWCVLKGHGQA